MTVQLPEVSSWEVKITSNHFTISYFWQQWLIIDQFFRQSGSFSVFVCAWEHTSTKWKEKYFCIYDLALMEDPHLLTVKNKHSMILIIYIHRYSKSTFRKFSWLWCLNSNNLSLVNAIQIMALCYFMNLTKEHVLWVSLHIIVVFLESESFSFYIYIQKRLIKILFSVLLERIIKYKHTWILMIMKLQIHH